MASFNADLAVTSAVSDGLHAGVVAPFEIELLDFQLPARFHMRARDANSASLTYRNWTTPAAPDFDAAQYSGPFDGVSLNLVEVTVIAIEE
jgi:hypothetical protein